MNVLDDSLCRKKWNPLERHLDRMTVFLSISPQHMFGFVGLLGALVVFGLLGALAVLGGLGTLAVLGGLGTLAVMSG